MIPDVPAGSRQPQPSSAPPLRSTGGTAAWSPPSAEELQGWLVNYEIIRIIGQGGMGAVYEGRQISLDRRVAIKLLSPEALDQTAGVDSVERFKNEARSMARMNHPGIVSVYDFGETSNDQFYLVMENVDGTDVAQMILSQGRLPDEHALSITAHVCDALQYAHSHGLIHRDIKPANILLNREGKVKIADFGLAKGIEPGATGLTQSNVTMGTPDFIAPEALIEGMTVDHRSDIYSVGVMLYNMLTGEIPRGMFKKPSIKAGSDPRFDAIIHKAIQAEREDRYQTTQELRRDLDVILTIPMVKLEDTGRVSVPGPRSSSKPISRPVATGPRKTATGPRRTEAGSRVATGAQQPARGMVPAQAAQPASRVSGQVIPRRTKPPAGNPSLLYGGIAAAVLVLGGAGWWMMGGGGRKTKPPPLAAAGAAGEAPKVSSQLTQPKPPAPPPSNAGNILPPNITELRHVPRHRWFTVLASRESAVGKKGITWQDGWVDCRGDHELLGFTALGGGRDVPNMALKAVVRPPRPGKEWMWTFREGAHGGYRLVVRSDRLALDFADPAAGSGQAVRLREGSFPKALATAPQWLLEATIRGDRFFVSINGQEIFSQDKLKLLEPGSCWLRPGTSGGLTVKDLSFKILDDQAVPPVAGGGSSLPSGVVRFKDHRYQAFPDKLRWNEAKTRAESVGGHLVTITSREEDDWIASTFVKQLPVGQGLWIGGTHDGKPSQWRWGTGETFSFTNWVPGEPNNRADESALMFIRNDQGQIGWIDLREDGIGNKDRRAGFLVEWDDPGAPAVGQAVSKGAGAQ